MCWLLFGLAPILSGTAGAPQHYARRVREDIGADLGRAARVKELFFRPRFTRLLIDALQQSAGIRKSSPELAGTTELTRCVCLLCNSRGKCLRLWLSAHSNH